MQKANLAYKGWLIEDNITVYQKVTKMCANIIKEKDIKNVNWLANSSDLHIIENIWDWKKELLSSK